MTNNDKTMISVPVEDANRYLKNMNDLLDAHFTLIDLFQQEEKLKKHHRPYLHVREQIAETIEKTHPILLDIAVQLIADDADFIDCDDGNGEDVPDFEDDLECVCDSCPCGMCEVECLHCQFHPHCPDLSATEDEYSKEAMKSGLTSPTGDFEEYLNAPDGSLVLMKKGDCDTLLNAILMLAEQVRMVTEMRCEDYDFIDKYAKYFPAFAAFEHDRLNVYKDARFEADEITDFIGEADFRSYPMTTVELPN